LKALVIERYSTLMQRQRRGRRDVRVSDRKMLER
jgi:hypothetical protein